MECKSIPNRSCHTEGIRCLEGSGCGDKKNTLRSKSSGSEKTRGEGDEFPSPPFRRSLPDSTQPKMDKQTEVREHPSGQRVPCASIHKEDAVQQRQHGDDVERDGRSERSTDESQSQRFGTPHYNSVH